MLNASLTVCTRCQHSFFSVVCSRSFQTSAILQRSGKSTASKGSAPRQSSFRALLEHPTRHTPPRLIRPENNTPTHGQPAHRLSSTTVVRQKLNEGLYRWARLPATMSRLKAMGIKREDAKLLLETFVEERPKRLDGCGWFPPEEDDEWQLHRIRDDMAESLPASVDKALTRRFMAWAMETSRTRGIVAPSVYASLAAVQTAVDYTHPAEWYPIARKLRRKFHMHVGPTNSGKTHNALRALAASARGVYASPLRLLAYEVFDRLNKGSIVPLNADPNAPPETFKRDCNLVTGEEIRTVGEQVSLLSCTVEMLDLSKRYEVAVIDEIQMIADLDRGGAWTAAVLGVHAEEVHLCGEAGAVPLIQSMLKETGDELVVHRYERLTPLVMASESLRGDLRKISKGDCIVSFSRTSLFNLKKEIEKTTGHRCAIIYGRLPPEVRSEQAELFNDPNSGYDVLVGSDAIGMGLNLKIKRIIFESTVKFDGGSERTLSLSQLKQIAGRAGRFGLHGDDTGGIVTTWHDEDLPIVRRAVESRSVPIAKRAVLPTTREMFHDIEQLIRPHASFSAAFDLIRTTARMTPDYTLRDYALWGIDIIPLSDKYTSDYTLEERLRVFSAPVQWRDTTVANVVINFLKMYKKDMHVRLVEGMQSSGLLEVLKTVREERAVEPPSSPSPADSTSASNDGVPEDNSSSLTVSLEAIEVKSTPPKMNMLLKLESLYRIAVVYMWFSLRLPLAFNEREQAVSMKEEVEDAIDWCLEKIKAERVQAKKQRAGSGVKKEKEKGERKMRRVDGLDDAVPRKVRIARLPTGTEDKFIPRIGATERITASA